MSARKDSSRILIVDDEPIVRETIRMMLAYYGYKAEVVASGEEAVQRLESGSFDLLITDYSMNGIDGDRLCQEIKRRWPGQRVLMVTAYATGADDPMFNHADAILSKPFMALELHDAVSRLLEQRA